MCFCGNGRTIVQRVSRSILDGDLRKASSDLRDLSGLAKSEGENVIMISSGRRREANMKIEQFGQRPRNGYHSNGF